MLRRSKDRAGAQPALNGDSHGPGVCGAVESNVALRAAGSRCTILIVGETGAGKGHLAKWLHDHSPRREAPFVPVNCGAIPDSIIDSQLFGHARGAFSGAVSDHLGLVRAAESGTLLLDEISELPPSAQARMLRLLQECEVQPVGHSRPVAVDVRVMAATSTDLRRAVARNRFREDLWFRLDVVVLQVKPLRNRPEELVALLTRFNADLGNLYQQEQLEFERESVEMLTRYSWPGNIRQLRTLVERLHVLCPGESITPRHLHEVGQLPIGPANRPRRSLEDIKIDEVKRVIADSGGSVTRAASVFGVHRSTIYRWLRSRE